MPVADPAVNDQHSITTSGDAGVTSINRDTTPRFAPARSKLRQPCHQDGYFQYSAKPS
jgi:hypothetical protein